MSGQRRVSKEQERRFLIYKVNGLLFQNQWGIPERTLNKVFLRLLSTGLVQLDLLGLLDRP